MPARYCLELDSPAEGFMDSYLIGNGRLGATVRGGIGTERIDINLDRLWSGGPEVAPVAPSPAHLLPELRQAVRAGNSALADQLSRQMQGSGRTQSYQPLGGLLWMYAGAAPADLGTYRRQLDMQWAIATTRYASGARQIALEGFVSAPDDVAVFSATGDGVLELAAMSLAWDCPHPSEQRSWTEGSTRFLALTGRVPAHVEPPYVESAEPIGYASDAPDSAGLVDRGMGFAAVAALLQQADGTIRLFVTGACGFRGAFARPSADVGALAAAAEARLRAALARDPADLRDAHVADYRAYFDRADLRLPNLPGAGNPAEAELLFHFGRYLLISSSRPDTEPANLQGIWNPYRRPAWSSNHTTNINTQMNYWPAEPTGLGDLAAPLMTMIEELVEAGSRSARHFYGAPGAVTHHNTDLWRFTRPVKGTPVWANWTGGLPWLVAHAWDHWTYGSGDEDFARTRLLPIMSEVVRFALFMLVEDGKGSLIVSPSSSPEHLFIGVDGKPWGVTEGATMDQELLAELFRRFILLSRRFGAEVELAEHAEAALQRLRPPRVDASGAIMEWAHPLEGAEPGHRHLSHLYAMYPGSRIPPGATGEDVASAGAALDDRLAHGTGHTGWSQSWVLCLAARLGDRQLAADAIATLLTKLTTRALLVLHPYQGMPDDAVFQIDGNFGATAGIAEMLLQSAETTIILLRTVPESWSHGSFSGLRARGGHRVSAEWRDGGLVRVEVLARASTVLALDIPAGGVYQVSVVDTGAVCPSVSSAGIEAGRRRIEWQASAGVTYRIACHQ